METRQIAGNFLNSRLLPEAQIQGVSERVYWNSIYRQRLTAGVFDVSTVMTHVVSSQHLLTPRWIVEEDLILVVLIAYPIFSALNNHDVKEYIYTTHIFLVWANPS